MLLQRGLALLLCGVLSLGSVPCFSLETSKLNVDQEIINNSGYFMKVETFSDLSKLEYVDSYQYNDRYIATDKNTEKKYLVDSQWNILSDGYDNIKGKNSLQVEKDGLLGLMDLDGNIIKPFGNYKNIMLTDQGVIYHTDAGMYYETEDYTSSIYNSIRTYDDYLIFDTGSANGIMSLSGEILMDAIYFRVHYFENSKRYALVDQNNYAGIYDIEEKREIVSTKYSSALFIGNDQFALTDDKNVYIIDNRGNVLKRFNGFTGFGNSFPMGIYKRSGNIYYDYKSDIVFDKKIDRLESKYYYQSDGDATLEIPMQSGVESKGDFEIVSHLQDEQYIVTKDDKYGLSKEDGEIIIPIEYDAISLLSDGLAKARKGELWGYINEENEWVIPQAYDDARSFSEGFAAVKSDDGWDYIDANGEFLTHDEYQDVGFFANGYAMVKDKDMWGFIDTSGEVVGKIEYEQVRPFFYPSYYAAVKKNGLWGLIDRGGNLIEACTHKKIMHADLDKGIRFADLEGSYSKEHGVLTYDELAKSTDYPYYRDDVKTAIDVYLDTLLENYPVVANTVYDYDEFDYGERLRWIRENKNNCGWKYGLASDEGYLLVKPEFEALRMTSIKNGSYIGAREGLITSITLFAVPKEQGTLTEFLEGTLDSRQMGRVRSLNGNTPSFYVSDVPFGYEANTMNISMNFTHGVTWVNNGYVNYDRDNFSIEDDYRVFEEILAPANLDISRSGKLQTNYGNETSEDVAKGQVSVVNGKPAVRVKDWGIKLFQRNGSSSYSYSMNMMHEAFKYYSESSEDAEAIYNYIDYAACNGIEISSPSGNIMTFGDTTVNFVDPGRWGIDVVFIEQELK